MKNWETRRFHHSDFFLPHLSSAGVGQLGELFQIVAAVNDAGVEEGGGFQLGGGASVLASRCCVWGAACGDARPTGRFRAGNFLCHERRLEKQGHAVNSRLISVES